MIRPDIWNDFQNLPSDAQQQVAELIDTLRRKNCCSKSSDADVSHDDAELQAWQDDADYFESIRLNLSQDKTYRQKYIAIRRQEIIDTDDDKFQLVERITRQYPEDVIFVAKVQMESQVVEIPSPEIGP